MKSRLVHETSKRLDNFVHYYELVKFVTYLDLKFNLRIQINQEYAQTAGLITRATLSITIAKCNSISQTTKKQSLNHRITLELNVSGRDTSPVWVPLKCHCREDNDLR